jgi:lysine 2,3-aminomutase
LSHASSRESELSLKAQYRIVDYCGDVHLYPPKP